MKTSLFLTILFGMALIATSAFAQEKKEEIPAAAQASTVQAAPGGQPSAEEMKKMMQQMMELAKLNENHKMLTDLAGTWAFTVKMWSPDPNAKPEESKGTAVRKSMMDGRFFVTDVTGKMQIPGPDGKKKDMTFKGMGIDGYDNVKKKFVGTWMDNMGTGILMSEGTYDPASKMFTYTSEYEGIPGMKTKVRETVKIVDKDHHTFEWYEDHGGKEVKTMEINYTRKK